MTNNVGTCSTAFPRVIGNTLQITDPSVINAITGQLDVGFIAFDNTGTMAVCSAFTRDAQTNPIYTFRTMTLDTQIDIQSILSQSY